MGENYEDEENKKEYVKKEFFARPYNSDGVTEADVNKLIIKNSRYVQTFNTLDQLLRCAWLSSAESLDLRTTR